MKLHFVGRLVAAARTLRFSSRLIAGLTIVVAVLAANLVHPAAAQAAPYTVAAGDTVKSIAADHGLEAIAPIVAANPQISDPDRIAAGQVIEVPDTATQSAPAPEPAPAADPAPTPAPAPTTHVVNPGDTLSKIAAAYGVASWHELWNANPQMGDPNRLNVGDVVTIPTGPTADRALPEAAPAPVAAPSAPADPTPAPAAAPASSGSGNAIVDFAKAQVGDRYVHGGNGPSAWDCSGLVHAAYASVGVSVPRTSGALASTGSRVSREDARPGDIVSYPGHAAIYAGNGMMVAAANSRDGVKFQTVYGSPQFRRI